MFVSRVNARTGRTEWVATGRDCEDEDVDLSPELARSQYGDMLHDTERNRLYEKGLRHAVEATRSSGREPHVLDIGAGTGLLSLMAARAGAATVTACEVMQPMVKIARQIVKENGFADVITIVGKRSTEVTCGPGGDMPARANILVSEVFDTELIGEGALATFAHAHKHLLEPGSIVVPSAAVVTVQLVSSDVLWSGYKLNPSKFPYGLSLPPSWGACSGPTGPWDLHLEQLFMSGQAMPLSHPTDIARFPFTEECVKEGYSCGEGACVCVEEGGVCDGVAMWWSLEMVPGGITLSTDPWHYSQWRDHWLQAVQLFPQPRAVKKGEILSVRCFRDDYSMWFTTSCASDTSPAPESSSPAPHSSPAPPICTCLVHTSWSRGRLSLSNDQRRNTLYLQALSQVVADKSAMLCVSDGCLLPLMLLKAQLLPQQTKVFMLESNPHSSRALKELLGANGAEERVRVLDGQPCSLCPEAVCSSSVDLLIGEPYFSSSLLPWHNLYFWFARTALSRLLSPECVVLPCRASLMAIAVCFDDLHKIKAPVGTVEGFNLSFFDKTVGKGFRTGSVDPEPHPLWEYPCVALSQPQEVMNFDFSIPVPEGERQCALGTVELEPLGLPCHGAVLWMDYCLTESMHYSTGLLETPRMGQRLQWDPTHKQAVYFLPAVSLGPPKRPGASLHYRAVFDSHSGEVDLCFDTKAIY